MSGIPFCLVLIWDPGLERKVVRVPAGFEGSLPTLKNVLALNVVPVSLYSGLHRTASVGVRLGPICSCLSIAICCYVYRINIDLCHDTDIISSCGTQLCFSFSFSFSRPVYHFQRPLMPVYAPVLQSVCVNSKLFCYCLLNRGIFWS